MPRRDWIRRAPHAKVIICINSVEHTVTEPAFLALMQQGLYVLQAIESSR